MKIFMLTFLLFTSPVFACWKAEGTLGVDGETWKISQKLDHDKEYLFPMGTFILKLKIKPGKKDLHQLFYFLQEKKNLNLTTVTEGDEEIKVNEQKEIFAKGKEGQPNSIITIKLIKI